MYQLHRRIVDTPNVHSVSKKLWSSARHHIIYYAYYYNIYRHSWCYIIHYNITNPLDSEPPARLRHIYLHDYNNIYYTTTHAIIIIYYYACPSIRAVCMDTRTECTSYYFIVTPRACSTAVYKTVAVALCVCVKTIGEKTDVCVVNWVVIRGIRIFLFLYKVYVQESGIQLWYYIRMWILSVHTLTRTISTWLI